MVTKAPEQEFQIMGQRSHKEEYRQCHLILPFQRQRQQRIITPALATVG